MLAYIPNFWHHEPCEGSFLFVPTTFRTEYLISGIVSLVKVILTTACAGVPFAPLSFRICRAFRPLDTDVAFLDNKCMASP